MALFQPVHSELATLAPDLWLRTRALEAWLNDKARQGWSLAAMDDADVMLKEDGGGRRYRVVAHAEAKMCIRDRPLSAPQREPTSRQAARAMIRAGRPTRPEVVRP